MGDLIVKAFIAYVQKNPAVIEDLIGKLLQALLSHLASTQSAPPVA